jgi:hypothetical protein
MIEHFSKWQKFMPLPNCSNEGIAYTFFNMGLNRFEALAKILTNQSTKFHGEFQELCEKTLINHCTISQNHFKVDMLVEWMVQMMKQGLQKYGIQRAIFKIGNCNYNG